MQINLVAVGRKMPAWVNEGCQDYLKRFNHTCAMNLITVPAAKRGKHADIPQILKQEATLISDAIPKYNQIITLDRCGKALTTHEIAKHLTQWQQEAITPCFIIGGPEGLAPNLLTAATTSWSLSKLTLPHPLARIMLIEQIYRAWSILKNHPYHR